jgi:hypothetical protein
VSGLAALSVAWGSPLCFGSTDGMERVSNGALMRKAEQEFDVFITGDRNLSFQQVSATFKIAIIVLHAESIQLHHTQPLMPRVLGMLSSLQPGQIVDIHP